MSVLSETAKTATLTLIFLDISSVRLLLASVHFCSPLLWPAVLGSRGAAVRNGDTREAMVVIPGPGREHTSPLGPQHMVMAMVTVTPMSQ